MWTGLRKINEIKLKMQTGCNGREAVLFPFRVNFAPNELTKSQESKNAEMNFQSYSSTIKNLE